MTVQEKVINGHAYSFASIELRWGDKRYTGFKSINYRHSWDSDFAAGSDQAPYAHTRGAYNGAEGDITFLKKTFNTLIEDIGPGYGNELVDIVVIYAEPNQPTVSDYIDQVKISEESFDNERGPDAAMVQRSFKALKLRPKGIDPVGGEPA